MPGSVEQRATTLWATFDAWLHRAAVVVADSAAALDAMNVYPVPDSDTGTNVRLTMDGIVAAVVRTGPDRVDGLVQGAILAAHGNSGAIVAEMMTSIARRLADQPQAPPGVQVADLLRVAATAARRAVARPVEGTIITVADAAADAAEAARTAFPEADRTVAEAAQRAARDALARTPSQLAVLAAAGVPDAGGQAYLLLLDALVEVLGGAPAEPLAGSPAPIGPPAGGDRPPSEYEVMYALHGAAAPARAALSAELSALGHSVVLVGDSTVAQVHVHLAEAGAAIEAALGRGRLSHIRVTALPPQPAAEAAERTVLSVVAGPGLATAVTDMGGRPVPATDREHALVGLTAAAEHACGDLIILPNDPGTLERAAELAAALRRPDRRVTVIPTVAQVQGLAAMAVHEPSADFESVVVAMSNAAGHARHGGVTVAEGAAMTMAGPCRPGDVLGIVMGDFVEIGASVADVAWAV
ncbi:MAG TPA: DAK2 domain-containing protein, partial [Propionibacteriaceae bacterium]|nr:DAK2 domain-containing protein [Propionibacteriaceae bacterium]